MEFGSLFVLSFSTLILTSVGLSFKFCLASRCSNISLCYGLIEVHRDIENELKIEELELKNNKKLLTEEQPIKI